VSQQYHTQFPSRDISAVGLSGMSLEDELDAVCAHEMPFQAHIAPCDRACIQAMFVRVPAFSVHWECEVGFYWHSLHFQLNRECMCSVWSFTFGLVRTGPEGY
jgi:hypothetical protein